MAKRSKPKEFLPLFDAPPRDPAEPLPSLAVECMRCEALITGPRWFVRCAGWQSLSECDASHAGWDAEQGAAGEEPKWFGVCPACQSRKHQN